MRANEDLKGELTSYFERLAPGSRIERLSRLDGADAAEKAFGYGKPIRVELRTETGEQRRFVFHVAQPNAFGHDRRADRAADAILAFDTFRLIPNHVAAVDFGAVRRGELVSLGTAGEFFVITGYADGEPYAHSLLKIGSRGSLCDGDLQRCDALADYLARIHSQKIDDPNAYRRSIRDLVGHGEGIFGLVDNFPDDVAGAPKRRIDLLERRCVEWRQRLRGCAARLSRTHGDFHPFNILFRADRPPILLDASRGSQGDPADDVVCLSVNYLFFGLEHGAPSAFRALWDRFWNRYLANSGDRDILSTAPPFLAWRVLVLTNPVWYPNASAATREVLLRFAEKSLESGILEPNAVSELLE